MAGFQGGADQGASAGDAPGGERPAPRNGGRRRFAFAAVGAALSVAGIWWVFHRVDPAALLGTAHRVRPWPMLASLAVYWAGLVVLRAFLVRHLLAPVGRIGLAQAYRCIGIGFLGNNVLPLRAGDLARSVAIHRGTGIGFAPVVGSLAVERMLDLALVALLALAAIRVAPGLPDGVGSAALVSAIVLGAGFAVLVFLARRRRGAAPGSALPGPARELWGRFSSGFGSFATAGGVAVAAGLAIGIWLLALAVMLLRLSAFGLEPDPALALVLLASVGFGVAVPSAPGYVGTYHAAVAFGLGLFGFDHDVAAAFGLFSWIMDIGGSSLAGGICLSLEGLRLGDLRRRPK